MRKSELKIKLSELAFQVTQNAATEPPFTGEFFDFFEDGVYKCICCDAKLFSSKHKFNSSTGWPSFHSCINEKVIDESIEEEKPKKKKKTKKKKLDVNEQ